MRASVAIGIFGAALILDLTAAFAAPPAPEVLAEVRAVSALSVGFMERVNPEGDLGAETATLFHGLYAGLGEVMGWGQDRFDNVDPAVTARITEQFTQLYRYLEGLGDPSSGFTAAQVKEISGKGRSSFQGFVDAASSGTPDIRHEIGFTAKLLHFHVTEVTGDGSISEPRARPLLVVRYATVGLARLELLLEDAPDLRRKVAAELEDVRAFLATPRDCGDTDPAACAEAWANSLRAPLEAIENALRAP